MKLVKSVFRMPHEERVFDPAEKLVEAFNKHLELLDPRVAEVIDYYAEQIVNVRLTQDNTIVEGSETDALYHERRRGWSGVALEDQKNG